jgi:hypothetical protein
MRLGPLAVMPDAPTNQFLTFRTATWKSPP